MKQLARTPGITRFLRQLDRNFPSYCLVCNQYCGGSNIDLCSTCQGFLPGLATRLSAATLAFDTICVQCGYPWRGNPQFDSCPHCIARKPVFTRIVVPYLYDWPVDCLIHQLKYRHQRTIARVFGILLARHVVASQAALPDSLLAVPQHDARLRTRGFNHAADIAHWCGQELGIAAKLSAAKRIVDTGSLAGLSRTAREDRIRGAFRVDESLAGLRVAIVDDVLTTGATAGEFARELYDTGAEEVSLWAIARTPRDS